MCRSQACSLKTGPGRHQHTALHVATSMLFRRAGRDRQAVNDGSAKRGQTDWLGWAAACKHEAMSWDEAFADRYEDWSAEMTADIAFYAGLARQAAGPLVELAIGNGRVAIPVAQATGQRVIGIYTSPAMLAQARARAAAAGVQLDLREGDMRELALDEPAALIYCPFRALLHLPTWADRRRTFDRVAASLGPGGRFAWNAFAFDHHIAAAGRPAPARASAAHQPVRGGRQPDRHHPRRRRDEFPVVGHQERVARTRGCRGPGGRGALRRLRRRTVWRRQPGIRVRRPPSLITDQDHRAVRN